MAIGIFITRYKRKDKTFGTYIQRWRYCAMNDFKLSIRADGGKWKEIEILGDRALVRVEASASTLTTIAAAPGIFRFPTAALNNPLSALTANQRNTIVTQLQDMGYPLQEIQDRLGADISSKTLMDVLKFASTRRRAPRYDQPTDIIVCDGDIVNLDPTRLNDW